VGVARFVEAGRTHIHTHAHTHTHKHTYTHTRTYFIHINEWASKSADASGNRTRNFDLFFKDDNMNLTQDNILAEVLTCTCETRHGRRDWTHKLTHQSSIPYSWAILRVLVCSVFFFNSKP